MKRNYLYCMFCLVGTLCIVSGCKKETAQIASNYVYYLNNEEDKIIGEPYVLKETEPEKQIIEYIQQLESVPKSRSCKNVLPSGMNIDINDIQLNVNGQLTIYFSSEYYQLTGMKEVLCRAAVVKTLSQLDMVKSVDFYVDGNPLVISDNTAIGDMYPEDFLDYSQNGKEYCQQVNLKLYFADKKGNHLVAENVSLEYDGDSSLEELIVKELMKGPSKKELLPTIPGDTTLLKINEQDGICYVDFNEKFLEKRNHITNDVAIYSVVNSLIEMSHVNEVQITINGKYVKKYQNDIVLEKPLERNLNIVNNN